MSDAPHYQPYWCEENAWHLCVDPRLDEAPAWVVIVTNAARTVLVWNQRAASEPGAAVAWDYHVFVLARREPGWQVWDLDTTIGMPAPADAYLARCFRAGPPRIAPCFHVLDAADYRRVFASDRRHMRTADGGWQQPPPPWPAIGEGHRLPELLDPERPTPGVWLSLAQLRERCSSA